MNAMNGLRRPARCVAVVLLAGLMAALPGLASASSFLEKLQKATKALEELKHAGQRIAWAGFAGSRVDVVFDGQAGPAFDTLLPSADKAIVFSNDGEHFAYLGSNGDATVMVKDNKVLGQAQTESYDPCGQPAFSPQGRHVVCTNGRHDYFVMDGVRSPAGMSASPPAFSPDDEHIAYVLSNPHTRGSQVIFDGKPVLQLPPRGVFDDPKLTHAWHMSPDGSLQFLSKVPGGEVTRYKVTPVTTSTR